jgi:hypothetical protein
MRRPASPRARAVADAPGGLGAELSSVDIYTGADGVPRYQWRLGEVDSVQALAATLALML